MENINERTYSTEELKVEAKKLPEKKTITIKVVPGFSSLTPDQKAILKYNVNAFNKAVREFNNLRKTMIAGRIPDSENSKTVIKLKRLESNADRIYSKHIATAMRQGASSKKNDEVKNLQRKSAAEKVKTAQELASFKEKVKEYSKRMREA